jgi:hypothetical protein
MQISEVRIDKLGLEHYMRNYEEYMSPKRHEPVKLLELGVANGDSLKHWADWMPNASIVGLDINPPPSNLTSERIIYYQGEQQNISVLNRLAREQAPSGFDFIIDDASHLGQFTRISFWHLFVNHLKPGGLYFIEDWGTGYWPSYVDGRHFRPQKVEFAPHERILNKLAISNLVHNNYALRKLVGWSRWHLVRKKFPSHQYGMVGFIKELVDECGIADSTHESFGIGGSKTSRIEWMRVSLGHVIIKKPVS